MLTSPVLDSTIISLLPRLIFPKETTPSISETTEGFDGLRASNNSVTRGKPPVISPALPDFLGILTNVCPDLPFHCHSPLSEHQLANYKNAKQYHLYLQRLKKQLISCS